MATTLSKIFRQILDDYAISLSYQQYAERFGMTADTFTIECQNCEMHELCGLNHPTMACSNYKGAKKDMPQVSKQRKCAKCGQPAGIKNPLYSSKEGKLCRNCLPFQMTITEGKTQLVITDRAKFDAYIRKETWEQAYYEVCNEERAHLDGMLKPMAQTSLNLYLSERKWSRLCHCRMVYHHEVLDKYVNFGNLFRSYMLGWMQRMFEEWQKHWYYKRTWRFDPLQSKMDIGNGGYKWEQFYPLLNDPAIHSAGVEIGARVEVTSGITGTIHGTGQYVKGRVVFRHKYSQNGHCAQFDTCTKDKVCCPFCYKERAVDCTHVAITTILLTDIPDSSVLDSKGREWAKTTENNREVKLAPEEHYVALRSFVAGIAEVGLETMFASRYPDDPLSLPFGFNTLMQKQILHCLKELCPNAAKSIIYKAVGYVLESAPDEWILQRKSLLNDTYGFTTVLEEHEFWEMADAPTQKRIVALLGKLVPQIPEDYWHDPIRGRNTRNVIYAPAAEGLHPGQPAEGVRGHHPDIVVTDELVGTWEAPLQDQPHQIEGAIHIMADAAHVPENILRGTQPGTVLGEDYVRYLVGQVRAVLDTMDFAEEILRQCVNRAWTEYQAQNVPIIPHVFERLVIRAADLCRQFLRDIHGNH